MKLNELRDNQGARKMRMRVGRGAASGKGKTAGRGMNGQKSRSGVAMKGFEGGQMPLNMRLPKRGFNVPRPKKLNAVNLGRLQRAIDAGKLTKGTKVTAATLVAAGIMRRELDGVRILAKGTLKDKLDFEIIGASKAAQQAIEKLGGKINIISTQPTKGKPAKGKPAKDKPVKDKLAKDKPAKDNGETTPNGDKN